MWGERGERGEIIIHDTIDSLFEACLSLFLPPFPFHLAPTFLSSPFFILSLSLYFPTCTLASCELMVVICCRARESFWMCGSSSCWRSCRPWNRLISVREREEEEREGERRRERERREREGERERRVRVKEEEKEKENQKERRRER